MAASWIRPIHVNKGKTIAQTLAASTGYIENPDKTKNGYLVTGYACNPRTADEEFLIAKREYEYVTGRNQGDRNILAYHIRQSFKPGEISPEEANKIGHELALRWTKGNHSFIVATHVDRKHIHNHIIFNSTSLNCDSKFNNFFGSSFAIRRLSDLICAEHGLSIIKNPKPSKGKNYAEWLENKEPSRQEKLRNKIDEVLPLCSTFEDFLAAMKTAGYIINDKRKHITFLAPGQKNPTRLNTLRGNHTEAAIRERLAGTKIITSGNSGGHVRLNLLVDIQAKIREGKGAGYEQWAHIFNIKQTAKTLFFLRDNGIDSYDELKQKSASLSAEFNERLSKIKTSDNRLKEISELQKQIGTYGKTRDIYAKYRASGWNKGFFEEHRADITLHQAAKKHFDSLGLKKLPSIASLKQEYAALLAEKKSLYSGFRELKETRTELLTALGNAERILGIDKKAPKQDKNPQLRRSDLQSL